MKPNFLIVGAARSGTTYLARNLREHPEVFIARKKELHFFNKEYQKGIDYYERYFEEANLKDIDVCYGYNGIEARATVRSSEFEQINEFTWE